MERGDTPSARDHFLQDGLREGRLDNPEYRREIGLDDPGADAVPVPAGEPPRCDLDVVVVSKLGAVFIVGWIDDRANPLVIINVRARNGALRSWTRFPRLRRADVAAMTRSWPLARRPTGRP